MKQKPVKFCIPLPTDVPEAEFILNVEGKFDKGTWYFESPQLHEKQQYLKQIKEELLPETINAVEIWVLVATLVAHALLWKYTEYRTQKELTK